MQKVDVIIPVYRPGEEFEELLEKLENQSQPVNQIFLINTEKEYFERWDEQRKIQEKWDNIHVTHIEKQAFDHAGTRNQGVNMSDSPFFVMMTDDALPADERLLERLLTAFDDREVGLAYARQLPARDCGLIERYTRAFNYPEQSAVKAASDLKSLGIKAFFASNVCAAYRRDWFDQLGGFASPAIFNEDMVYARKLMDAGHKIAYVADAGVVHSHNYSGFGQFHRNFDLGVSHRVHPEVFSSLATESEGIRLVKSTAGYLWKKKKPWLIVKLIWSSGCKYIGYFLGKRYEKLPASVVRWCSMNREYWKQIKKES